MAEHVRLFEMGPRDGLQNESHFVATESKVELVDLLTDCGFSHIEVSSFVSPKWVPQLADAANVFAKISRRTGVVYSALTPNLKGYEAAMEAGANEVAVFASASEGFSQSNINCSIRESISRFRPIMATALVDKVQVRGYVSMAISCPFDGDTPPEKTAEIVDILFQEGCYEVSLGDTIGSGTQDSISAMLEAVLKKTRAEDVAGHYHDTNHRALNNIAASLDFGMRKFDSAVGGLGGCPFAKSATGNVDSLAVANMLLDLGYETGLDMNKLHHATQFAGQLHNRMSEDELR